MKVIPANYEIIKKETGIMSKIELAARTCYKSEDKITDESALKMFNSLVERKHMAMLEHANICIGVSGNIYNEAYRLVSDMKQDCYKEKKPERCYLRFSTFLVDSGGRMEDGTEITSPFRYVISGNVRAWLETFMYFQETKEFPECIIKAVNEYIYNNTCMHINDDSCINVYRPADMFMLSPNERMLHEILTVKFTVDRGVTHELVRMRECSFAQESTRYCNYNKGKFGNELTVVKPLFFKEGSNEYKTWYNACLYAESQYNALTGSGVPPQEARSILPNSLKSEIVVTANLMEWRHVFELRACDMAGKSHPQMKETMVPLLKEMKEVYPFAFGDLKPAEVC